MGGGLLLAAALAAVFTGGDDPSARRATGNTLAVIDPDSNRLVETIPTGVRPADVSAGADHIWVANQADDTATQIDPRRREVVSTTAPGPSVAGLAAGDKAVWIGDARRTVLLRLDPDFRSVVRTARLETDPGLFSGPGPNPVATGYGAVWVGSAYAAIARVDTRTREVENIPVGNSPSAVASGRRGRVGHGRRRQHGRPDRSGERQRRHQLDTGRARPGGGRDRCRSGVGGQHAGRHGGPRRPG